MSGHILPLVSHNGFNVHKSDHGEDIFAKESNVYTILPGTVSATFSVGKDHCVIISTGDIYIVYAQLSSCLLTKDDAVDQNVLLGYASYSESDSAYKINVQAWRSRSGKTKEDKKLLLALVE
jgi:hypothetical protein